MLDIDARLKAAHADMDKADAMDAAADSAVTQAAESLEVARASLTRLESERAAFVRKGKRADATALDVDLTRATYDVRDLEAALSHAEDARAITRDKARTLRQQAGTAAYYCHKLQSDAALLRAASALESVPAHVAAARQAQYAGNEDAGRAALRTGIPFSNRTANEAAKVAGGLGHKLRRSAEANLAEFERRLAALDGAR